MTNIVEIFPQPKLIKELVEEFDVDEHGRGMGKLVRDHVQKCFGTKRVAFGTSFAPLRFEGRDAELEHAQSVSV